MGKKTEPEKPSITTSLIDFVATTWIIPLLNLATKRDLTTQDLYQLPPHLKSAVSAQKLAQFKDELRSSKKSGTNPPNLTRHTFGIIASNLLVSFVIELVILACTMAAPQFVQALIIFVDPTKKTSSLLIQNGLALAFIITALQLVPILGKSFIANFNRQIRLRVTNALNTAVYEKTFALSPKSRVKFSEGNILNLINTDSLQVVEGALALRSILLAPLQLILSMYFLWKLLGVAILAALGTTILVVVVSGFVGKIVGPKFGAWFGAGDKRISLMGMKIVKYRCLEDHCNKNIAAARKKQVSALLSIFKIVGSMNVLIESTVPAMILATVPLYAVFNKGKVDASVIFPALLYFDKLREPFSLIPGAMKEIVAARLSIARIGDMLCAEESITAKDEPAATKEATLSIARVGDMLSDESTTSKDEPTTNQEGRGSISIIDATWQWPESADAKEGEETGAYKVSDISLEIPVQSRVAVVGSIGSGKSSLLLGLIGDIDLVSGSSKVNGSIAYASQMPWLTTGSIKENILFGSRLDDARLEMAVRGSGMTDDLASFSNGIDTLLGENGVSLSGGQKARVGLARALYRDSDIAILDCPLAALDARVARQVFDEGIVKGLCDRTVLMVTHKLSLLPRFDLVVVMELGRVVQFGRYDELVAVKGPLQEMMKSVSDSSETPDAEEEKVDDSSKAVLVKKEDVSEENDLMEEEEMNSGSISKETFKRVLKVAGIGPVLSFVVTFVLFLGFSIAGPYWLTVWMSAKDASENMSYYMNLYIALNGGLILFLAGLFFSAVFGGIFTAIRLHDSALAGILTAPMSFFDANPVGRILNRFSSDVTSLDTNLADILIQLGIPVVAIISTCVFILLSSVYLLVLFVFLVPLCIVFYRKYKPSNLSFKRLVAIEKSPLDSFVSNTLAGQSILRSYQVERSFIEHQRSLLDNYEAASYTLQSCQIWFGLRLDLVSLLVSFAIAILASMADSFSSTFAAAIGLGLTYSSTLSQSINIVFKAVGKMDAEMNSVERLLHYGFNLASEPAKSLPSDPKNWPRNGTIVLKDVSVAYPSRPDKKVIKNLTLSIPSGEKIGVVGRTGSGKSTLVTTLFRIINEFDGSILIDGVGLGALRRGMYMVPQEPVMFQGTIRTNIDIESLYSDADIWVALKHCGLEDYVSSLPEKLDAPVEAEGANFSLGQKQALSLVPAVLSRPKIIVFDEATSAMDAATDRLVQDLVKTVFASSTLISIAHRLSTVATFDRVLVLDQGVLAECDHPSTLLSDPDSSFYSLAKASGEYEALVLASESSRS